jgi:hypothetical protein
VTETLEPAVTWLALKSIEWITGRCSSEVDVLLQLIRNVGRINKQIRFFETFIITRYSFNKLFCQSCISTACLINSDKANLEIIFIYCS